MARYRSLGVSEHTGAPPSALRWSPVAATLIPVNAAYGQQGPQWGPPGTSPQWGGQQPQWGPPGQQQWQGGQSTFGGWGGNQPPPGQFPYGRPQPSQQPGPWGPPQGRPVQGGGFQPLPGPRKPKAPLALYVLIGAVAAGLVLLVIWAFMDRDTGGGTVQENYQNEDYELPSVDDPLTPLPEPTTEAEMMEMLQANPWYGQDLPVPVRCELPGTSAASANSIDALQTRMEALVECLTRTVGPSLEAAGFDPYVPRVTIYPAGTEVNTQCGAAPSGNAFFCGADQALYLAPDVVLVLPEAQGTTDHVYDYIMAHEYGHAMQGRTGIIVSSAIATYLSETEAEGMEFSRRTEVQADCFATTMLTSVGGDMGVGEAEFSRLHEVAFEIGDDRISERFGVEYAADESSHGTGDSRRLWAERGTLQSDVGVCNTFTAPAQEVR